MMCAAVMHVVVVVVTASCIGCTLVSINRNGITVEPAPSHQRLSTRECLQKNKHTPINQVILLCSPKNVRGGETPLVCASLPCVLL